LILNNGFDPAAWSTLITAFGVGIVSIIGSLNITKKINQNQVENIITLERNHSQLSDLSRVTKETNELANGNLTRLNDKLEAANNKISALNSLSPNFDVLNNINLKLDGLMADMSVIRERQHDLANFIQKQGFKFDLKQIPKVEEKKV
jgi:hypothetical protein